MHRLILTVPLFLLTGTAFAAGTESETPPTPTETTVECAEGTVWDEDAKECVAPQESSLDDDALYDAARELAYAGRYDEAIATIRAMSDPESDRALTYLGFAYRKSGRVEEGMSYYQAALDQNPDNILARSYMGQSYAELGDMDAALAQLQEIKVRGGRETWAYLSLKNAIRNGKGYSY